MTDIFLSRTTWILPEYQEGLELNPRTIGATDFPIESPLDEVIQTMEQTSGVIILGYPQIFVQSGKIKDDTISNPIYLATEWNNIEAS
jgi:hypothetical protein